MLCRDVLEYGIIPQGVWLVHMNRELALADNEYCISYCMEAALEEGCSLLRQ